jgi:hypothetical protein
MNCFRQFFEDYEGHLSSARLCMITGMMVGSFIVVWMAISGTLDAGIFVIYMAASGGVYGVGKWRDSIEETVAIQKAAEPLIRHEGKPDVKVNTRPAAP